MLIFAVHLGLFPVFGPGGIEHFILPAITLGIGGAALTTRLLRSSMIEVLSADYIRTARAKGVTRRAVIAKHAMRNALIPVVTVIGLQVGFVLGGSVIVETVFALPGLGWLMVESINGRDYAMVQAITLVYAVTVIIANLVVDISYAFLDPKIRYC
jgi:peptide/nickel transport system permease protein